MANLNCGACDELKQLDPNFIINGIGNSECTSLQNNTGLVASSGHTDCQDLDTMNDCLIGNMATEIEIQDYCDWMPFTKKLTKNLHQMGKAFVCSMCGIWTNINNLGININNLGTSINNLGTSINDLWTNINDLWTNINNIGALQNRMDCILDYISEGASFTFGEYTSTGASYIVAGRGVSFANVSASGTAADLKLTYVAGGISQIVGSLRLYTENFTDAQTVSNFDQHGTTPTSSANRLGNTKWGEIGYVGTGGELLYELRLKRSDYPQIGRFFGGHIAQSSGIAFTGEIRVFGAGQFAFGQTGDCNTATGAPASTGADEGHVVPEGWIYIQARMKSSEYALGSASGKQISPYGLIPMRIKQDSITC